MPWRRNGAEIRQCAERARGLASRPAAYRRGRRRRGRAFAERERARLRLEPAALRHFRALPRPDRAASERLGVHVGHAGARRATSSTSRSAWGWRPRRRCWSRAPSITSARRCCTCRRDCPIRARPPIRRRCWRPCCRWCDAAGGGAFLLFTSHRALGQAAALPARRLAGGLAAAGAGRGAARTAAAAVSASRAARCCSARRVSGKGWTCRAARCAWSSSTSCPSPRPTIRSVRARVQYLQRERRQAVPRLPAARGGAGAEAGCRPADPQRGGRGRGRDLRPAPQQPRLRAQHARLPAADAASRAVSTRRSAGCERQADGSCRHEAAGARYRGQHCSVACGATARS